MPPPEDSARELGHLARQYAVVRTPLKEELLSRLNTLGQGWGLKIRDYKGSLLVVVPEERRRPHRVPRELHFIASVVIMEDSQGRCVQVIKDRFGDYTQALPEPPSSWERLLGEDIV